MIHAWAWLWDTSPFKVPQSGSGWTPELVWWTETGNYLIWLVYSLIAAGLAALFLRLPERPQFFHNHWIRWLFVSFILLCGQTYLLRARFLSWPAYRLEPVVTGVNACVSLITLMLLLVEILPALLQNPPPSSAEITPR
jgi:hypothetical protein